MRKINDGLTNIQRYFKNHPDKAKERNLRTLNYYHNHRKEMNDRSNKYAKEKNEEYKTLVFNHYGDKCSNPDCPIPPDKMDIHCLVIDHIYGGGNKHRKSIGSNFIYRWLVKNNFPEGFQVLCVYCNWRKRFS
jgi:hypothetical protein